MPEGVVTVVARSRDASDSLHSEDENESDAAQADARPGRCCCGNGHKNASLLCMMTLVGLFCCAELIGGVWSGSLALLSDAFHMLSDFLSLLVAFVAIRLATRTRDSIKSYGWQRAEIIGALMNGVFLASACIFIALDAAQRLLIEQPERLSDPLAVLLVGTVGLAINLAGLTMFVPRLNCLAAHAHSHSHGHNHQAREASSSGEDDGHLNMHGVFLHVAGDALGSLIVIGVALCHMLTSADDIWPAYTDPLCSLAMAAVIARAAVPLIRRTTHILMQSVPASIDLANLQSQLEAIDNVETVHALHVWQISETRSVGSVHVRCTDASAFDRTCRAVKRVMHRHEVHETAVQPEFGHAAGDHRSRCNDEQWCCSQSVRHSVP